MRSSSNFSLGIVAVWVVLGVSDVGNEGKLIFLILVLGLFEPQRPHSKRKIL